MEYGERHLTLEEVVDKIPSGLMPADSAAMFQSIVDAWMKDAVLAEFDEERLYDLNEIDRRVNDYRNHLIVLEYLTRMRETHKPKIEEEKIKEYYDRHHSELKLEAPLVKGVFLKINSSASGREEIKELITSDDPDKIDKLERNWLDQALEYNYFKDKWIEWETLSRMIPYRFGDAESFLTEHQYLETDYNDCSYYLSITDYLPAGEEEPFEFARIWISDILTKGALTDYENQLVNSLIEKAEKEKKLVVYPLLQKKP